ncbi:hypothetical protein BN1723_014004 [Verticillium longisporum]|uniref:Uncharacterized protein n=1 Tax=Verticillium longisporum TaxID=100787 RepID=A0A0G4M045_VERLO|nr:hypothetical protein BN1723_014004 [Verticillium longisporum]
MSSPTPQATAAQPDVLDVDEAAIRGDDEDSALLLLELLLLSSPTMACSPGILLWSAKKGIARLLWGQLFALCLPRLLFTEFFAARQQGRVVSDGAPDGELDAPGPIQSPFVAPNVNFLVDDIEAPWTFHKKFDFIYSRMMTAALADFPGFFQKAYENLTPGGWFEIADICPITSDDGTLTEDTSTHAWVTQLLEGTRKIGRPFDGAFDYKKQLEAQGFQNVQQVVFKWPQNTWPKDPKYKELGMWNLENITSGLHGLSAAVYTRVLGWSPEEMEVLLAKVRRELKDTRIHSYWPIYVVYGQKPESKKTESDEPEGSV